MCLYRASSTTSSSLSLCSTSWVFWGPWIPSGSVRTISAAVLTPTSPLIISRCLHNWSWFSLTHPQSMESTCLDAGSSPSHQGKSHHTGGRASPSAAGPGVADIWILRKRCGVTNSSHSQWILTEMDAKVNLFCITFFLGHNFKRKKCSILFTLYVNVGVLSIPCKFTYRNWSFLKKKKRKQKAIP